MTRATGRCLGPRRELQAEQKMAAPGCAPLVAEPRAHATECAAGRPPAGQAELIMIWLHELEELIGKILDRPMPMVPRADPGLYDDIRAIRLNGATSCCRTVLARIRAREGDAAGEIARQLVEPIRERLLREFPEHVAALDPDSWPAASRTH
jgi:hypothetical protein